MADQVGGVDYQIRISGNVNKFLQNMDAAQKKMNSLTQRVESLEKKVAQSFNKMGSSSKNSSAQVTKGFDDVKKAIQPSIGRLEDLTAMYRRVRESSQNVDQSGESFAQAGRAMEAYRTQMRNGFESTQHMNEATSRLKSELSEVERNVQNQKTAYNNMVKSVGNAERQVMTLTSRLKGFEDSEEPVNELTQALRTYRTQMENASGDSTKITEANEQFKTSLHKVKTEAESTGRPINGLAQSNTDLTKSLQNTSKAIVLALGPLSGIAARVTAFTSLVKTNTAAIATFTASIVAMVATLARSISAGMEFERQMLGIQAAIDATGRSAKVSVGEINTLAESIAEATLSGTQETRQAATILTTFGKLSSDLFKDILESAQGISSVFGSGLTANTRLLARALEEPGRSLDSLRRVGIQFSDQQREQIKQFERFGQVAKAQGVIMERFAVFQQLATAEAQGLAGALDTLNERMTKSYEAISRNAGINDALAGGFKALGDLVQTFSENIDAFVPLMDVFRLIVSGVSSAMELMADNTRTVATVSIALFSMIAAKGVSSLASLAVRLVTTSNLLSAYRSVVGSAGAASAGAAINIRTLAGAGMLLRASLGPAIAILSVIGTVMLQNKRNSESLEYAYLSLSNSTENLTSANKLLEESYNQVGEAALFSVRTALAKMQTDLNKTEIGVQQTVDNINSSIASAMGKKRGGRLMADFSGDLENLKNLKKEFNSVVKTIEGGGEVSVEALLDLEGRFDELGIAAEIGGKSISVWAADYQRAINSVSSTSKRLEELEKSFSKFGAAFEIGKLGEVLQEDFSDIFNEFNTIVEKSKTAYVQNLVDMGDTTRNVAQSIISKEINRIKDNWGEMIDAAEDNGNIDEMNRLIAEQEALINALNATMPTLVDRLGDLESAMLRVKKAEFGQTLRDMSYEMDIWSAKTEEARKNAQFAFDVEKGFRSLAKEVGYSASGFENLSDSIEIFKSQVAQSPFADMVDVSVIETEEQLEAAIRRVAEAHAAAEVAGDERNEMFKENNKLAKKQNKNIEPLVKIYRDYTDAINENAAAQEGMAALETIRRLQEQEEGVRKVDDAMEDLTTKGLAEFIAKTGVTANSLDELRDKLVEFVREAERAEESTSNIELLNDFMGARQPIAAVREEFRELAEAARAENDWQASYEVKDATIEKIRELRANVEGVGGSLGKIMNGLSKGTDQGGVEATAGGIEAIAGAYMEGFSALDGIQEFMDMNEGMMSDHVKTMVQTASGMSAVGEIAGKTQELLTSLGQEGSAAYKTFAIISIIASQAMAIASAWSSAMKFGDMVGSPQAGMAMGYTLTALLGATMGAQIAAVQSLATGGMVRGPGTGTSDSVPANLSNGEYVINAAAVKSLGVGNMETINSGSMPAMGIPTPVGGNTNVNLTIEDYSTGNKNYETQEGTDANGEKQIRVIVRDVVKESMRRGEFDRDYERNLGITRQPRKR